MRIAFVTLQYPPTDLGGIGSYVESVAGALARAGHDVTVVCANGDQRRSSRVVDGVRVERFPAVGPSWLRRRLVKPRQRFRTRLLAAVSGFAALRRLEAFDVVEAPEWKAQGLLLRFARRGRVVVHVHLPLELEFAWNDKGMSHGARLAGALEQRTARWAAARTATTRQTTRLPDGSRWLPDASVDLVTPPVDLDRPTTPVTDTAPTVVFLGRLERRKAPEDLVAALSVLAPEVPGLRCVLVGKAMHRAEGPYDRYLEEVARDLGVDIELREPVPDPSGLVAAARVVAVPSRYETLSMVVLEAFAAGRPAVMTDQVGAAELLPAELAELVVPVGAPDALAAALRPLLTDAARAGEVGGRARRFVRDLAAPARVVDSRLAVYERVSDRRGGVGYRREPVGGSPQN